MINRNQTLAEEKILAVADLLKGKPAEQICEEFEITSIVFSEWVEQYGEIVSQLNWVKNENERLRKMFVDLCLLNQCLNDFR
jgi:transposase-like protein